MQAVHLHRTPVAASMTNGMVLVEGETALARWSNGLLEFLRI